MGMQEYSVVVDSSDNIYVISGSGNTLIAQAYAKGVGYTWTQKTALSAAMPSYTEGALNNFAAAWHNVGTNGTIMVVASHTAGRTPNTTGDTVYALLNCQSLLAGSGTLLRNSGAARGVVVADYASNTGYYVDYVNETGNLLDVVAAPGTTDRGYVYATRRDGLLSVNGGMSVYRYILASGGTSVSDSDFRDNPSLATKDANSKVRVIGVDGTTFVTLSVDADATWGIIAKILQNFGTSASFSSLGEVRLDNQGITSMPSAATLAVSSAWDAVYDSSGNTLWIYYLDVANGNRLMKTAINMNTYLATGVATQVSAAIGAAGSTNYAIRVNRGKTNGQKVLVSVASKTSGGTHSTIYILDTLNVAPNAPTLTAKSNFDATASSVFTWTFSDPNAGDTQSAYQMQINNASTGASAVDTGKVTSTTSTRTLTASTLSNGISYQWRVRTYDALDAVGPYSTYGTFSTSAGGTVTITSPATDNLAGIITDDYLVQWSVAGTTQASYKVRVIRTSDSSVLSDTGYVTSTATSQTIAGMLTNVEYRVEVTVRNASLVESAIGTRLITPVYNIVPKPTFTVSVLTGAAYILISATNGTSTGDNPTATSNQILRRVNGSGTAYTIIAEIAVNSDYKDYAVASGVTYEYVVRAVA